MIEERKPMGAFEPGTFSGDRNGCAVWLVPFIGLIWMLAAATGFAQEPLEGPLRDAIAARLEQRLDENEAKQEANIATMGGIVSDWRKEARELRRQSAEERQRLVAENALQTARHKKENDRLIKRIRDWTPGVDIAERLQGFVAELRGVVWQIAGLFALIVVVVALGLMAIKFILFKVLSLIGFH